MTMVQLWIPKLLLALLGGLVTLTGCQSDRRLVNQTDPESGQISAEASYLATMLRATESNSLDMGSLRLADSLPLTDETALIFLQGGSSHGPVFTVGAHSDGTRVPLGGFSGPRPEVLVQWLAGSSWNEDLVELSVLLGGSLSVAGSRRHFALWSPRTESEREVALRWNDAKVSDWPRDTVLNLENDAVAVRTTVGVQRALSFDQPWLVSAYVFVFDSQRRLIGWSSHEGKSFYAPGVAFQD